MIISKLVSKHRDIQLKTWLDIAKLPKSSFYEWKNKLNIIDENEEILINDIKEIVSTSRNSYGYRRVTLSLRNKGILINHKKVLRLMKENNLLCRKFNRKSRKFKSFKGEVGKIADNHLNRNFNVDSMNKVWVTDVTEFKVEGSKKKLYLSTIMDLFNSEIISYSLSVSPTVKFTNEALEVAIKKLPDEYNLTLHSDQGFHYQHRSWVKKLENKNIQQSMSRRGNCLDNSPMESFFGLLKQEMLYGNKFKSIEHLKIEIEKYIEWYNNDRIKQKLNGLSPVQYRLQTA